MNMTTAPIVSLSIVSHGQGAQVADLLADIEKQQWNEGLSFEVIITLNIPEDEIWFTRKFSFPFKILRNDTPKGFGSNHNAAFADSRGAFFAVINPDIRMANFRISALLDALKQAKAGICGPLVLGKDETIQDSARYFPTISRLVMRKLLQKRDPDYTIIADMQPVNWLAGMFLLFPSDIYRSLNGFDNRYFMYMEDVEICRHFHNCGYTVTWVTSTSVVHDASRASRRNLQHMKWHIASMWRYLFSRSRPRQEHL